jgi:hypothetical protein
MTKLLNIISRHWVVLLVVLCCCIQGAVILLVISVRSKNAVQKSVRPSLRQQKLCLDEMIVVSNKMIGVTLIDLTRIKNNSVDYRWRRWLPNQTKDETGKGATTIRRIKIGDDFTIMGPGNVLKIGKAGVLCDVGGDDFIYVMYQVGATSVYILPDTNFETLTPSEGLACFIAEKTTLVPEPEQGTGPEVH